MKVAILSLTENSIQLYNKIQHTLTEYQITCFIEERFELWGTQYNDVDIISIGKAIEQYKKMNIEKFIIVSMEEHINKSMYTSLIDLNVKAEDILYADLNDVFMDDLHDYLFTYEERREFDTIEFHVADFCNMNCKYCTMFSGLVKDKIFPDVQAYRNDLLQISKCFRSLKRVKLLGGEPFINPELEKFIEITREIFPFTKILIITNGLLVTSMSQKRIDCIKNNGVEIVVSYYKNLGSKIDDIHLFLENNIIKHRITSCITRFYKVYDLSGKQNALKNFEECGCKEGCTTLRDGRLMSCFVPSVIHFADQIFDLGFCNKDYIDLYQSNLSCNLIRQSMKEPLEVCRYCLVRGISVEWQQIDNGCYNRWCDWSI